MIWLARALRAAAIAIAVLGVVDPVLTRPLADRPPVAVIDAGDATMSATVARALARSFDVRTEATAGAVATVMVGHALPAQAPPLSGALVAVVPPLATPSVRVLQIVLPAVTPVGSRVPVDVSLQALGAAGRTLRVDALADGVVLDRQTMAVKSPDERVRVLLAAPALTPGLLPITVRIADDARPDAALAAEHVGATEVRALQWRVLVADARPSWASTFVRRALEADRRFVVSSRVSVSRGLAAEAGGAPANLTDPAALERFDAVVIGAPDALSAAEVQSLEHFARQRGGAVVLLADRLETGASARLMGASSLIDVHGVERRRISADVGAMIATELAIPAALSPAAEVLATADTRPAVWSLPLGAGRVVVNGALDAWRYRAREEEGFAAFWSHAIATAAASAPPPVSVSVSRVLRPGAPVEIRATVRAAQLADTARPTAPVDLHAVVSSVDGALAGQSVRLWPAPERGVFSASFSPSAGRRMYRVAVDATAADGASIGTATADVLTGESGVLLPSDLDAWTSAHGGVVLTTADPLVVQTAVVSVVTGARPSARVHPMRSLWWWPVFVVLLGGEWWLRRQRGER